jgi:peroxiredoxin
MVLNEWLKRVFMSFKYDQYRAFRVLCLFCLFIAVLSGCKEAPAPNSGAIAPALSCNDIAGEYVNLSQLKNRVVVLYFWSSKCCGDKLKQLEPLYLQQKFNGLSILAIEVGGSKETVSSFVMSSGLTFTNLTDEYESLSRSYRVVGFPTIFVIDKNGVIRKKISGDMKIDQLSGLVTPLL